jgi:hypothetical protein
LPSKQLKASPKATPKGKITLKTGFSDVPREGSTAPGVFTTVAFDDKPYIRGFPIIEEGKQLFVVDMLKFQDTKITLEGPDKDRCYTVNIQYPMVNGLVFNGLPMGDYTFSFRVPPEYAIPPAKHIPAKELSGLVRLSFDYHPSAPTNDYVNNL